MGLQESVDRFIEMRGEFPAWRAISMLTEEAGEVQGAFNKMMDGNKRKPRDENDVIVELIQLIGCCFVAAQKYGLNVETAELQARKFLDDKVTQVLMDGWTPDDQRTEHHPQCSRSDRCAGQCAGKQ